MAVTPASSTSRCASRTPVVSPGRWPDRSLTVTGSPEPSRAARATATARSGSDSRAAPAPVLQTLDTGQPMLRSMRSAPASATLAAALRMTSGSWPKSWIETRPSSGWMRSSSVHVFSLRWCTAKLETISETASPAPWRLACRRTHQLPMPASGARTTRLGMWTPPSVQESVRRRSATPQGYSAVALVQQPQPGEGEQVVDLVDGLGEGHDRAGQPAGGDRRRVLPHLGAQPGDDRIDLAGVAVDDARADRVDRRLADELAWRDEVDLGQLGRALGQRLHRDLDARRDDAAQVLAARADRVEGQRGAEVDDHARALDVVVAGDGVDQAVGADLARVVVAQRHAGLHARPDYEHLVAEVALGHRRPLRRELRHGRGDDGGVEVAHVHAAQIEQRAQRRPELVGRRLADGREAPVLQQIGPVEGPEVRLRVADVDDEEQGGAGCSHGARRTDPLRGARLASVRGGRAGAEAQGPGLPSRRPATGPARRAPEAGLRAAHRPGPAPRRGREGRRLAAHHARARRARATAAPAARRR